MKPLSSWTVELITAIPAIKPLLTWKMALHQFDLRLAKNSLNLVCHWQRGTITVFTLIYCDTKLALIGTETSQKVTRVRLGSAVGSFNLSLLKGKTEDSILRYSVDFEPDRDTHFKFWPKDVINLTAKWTPLKHGTIHAKQIGNRTASIFYSINRTKTGSVFYQQDLTALNAYFEDTQTSGADLMNGEWPEMGFSLPPTTAPLKVQQRYTISQAIISFSEQIPSNIDEMCEHYLVHQAACYPYLNHPKTKYNHWPEIAENLASNLPQHSGCWIFAQGNHYLNAYVADYKTPPEIMVQLAVLISTVEFMRWKGVEKSELIDRMRNGLPAFYKDDIKTIVRWLPHLEKLLDEEEEQKKPNVMDSWYLHHPLMNLARLALFGDKNCEKLLLQSIDYAITAAKNFKYQWPVFYKMDTLQVIKAESCEGEGGEMDVPGGYADLMIKAYELTKEKKYLTEAIKATRNLKGLGFNLFYQANTTAFSALALLKLYKITGIETYLKLSYTAVANLIKNTQLWNSAYGHSKSYTTFFAIYPLKDAPYTAAYEEYEVYAAIYEYLIEAEGIAILPAVKLLLSEFVKYTPSRLIYYYPKMLPKDALSPEVKTGEIDPTLDVALEDLQDGWEVSGQVGQEVYGAGMPFGITAKQYFKIKDEDFLIFIEYPVVNFLRDGNQVRFNVIGSAGYSCKLTISSNTTQNADRFNLYQSNQLIKSSKKGKRIIYKIETASEYQLVWR